MTRFLLSLSLLFFALPAIASHLAGSDMVYALIDSNGGTYRYRVTLTIYQDCLNGLYEANVEDNPANIAVYTGAGTQVSEGPVFYDPALSADSLVITAAGLCDSGATAVPVCRNRKVFVQDYLLRPSATGYFITYERCCLNRPVNVYSPLEVGMGCYVTIPPSGVARQNNSAVFTAYPSFVIGNNVPLAVDCSASDIDGDSLSYELCAPSAGGSENDAAPLPGAPPYAPVNYTGTLNYSYPIYCSIPITIDAVTGLLTGTPDSTGLYLLAIRCNEWRNGVLINSVQREFEFTVTNCITPPRVAKESMILYPNPATSEINIISKQKMTRIALTNFMGQSFDLPTTFETVLASPQNPDAAAINISSLSPGIYFIKVDGIGIKKFVKE